MEILANGHGRIGHEMRQFMSGCVRKVVENSFQLPFDPNDTISILRWAADANEKEQRLRIAAETEVKDQQESAITLALDYGKPIRAYMEEFKVLRDKAAELYKPHKNRGSKMTPSGLLTTWLRKEYNLDSLRKGVQGKPTNYTVCLYNRTDILGVVEDLTKNGSEVQ
jgi:hypothetical protein